MEWIRLHRPANLFAPVLLAYAKKPVYYEEAHIKCDVQHDEVTMANVNL